MININNFLNEAQDPKAVEKIASRLNELLMNGEIVLYIAVQKKPAVNISPDCVALTNKRIIFCRPRNLGLSMDFQDYPWKEIADCHMKEGILGAEFSLQATNGASDRIDYLPKAQARKLYTFAQEQEEVQVEYRRQREMEEKRAAAGNITVTSAPTHTPAPIATPQPEQVVTSAPKPDEIMSSLQKLKALFELNLITQQEYDEKKAEILKRL